MKRKTVKEMRNVSDYLKILLPKVWWTVYFFFSKLKKSNDNK